MALPSSTFNLAYICIPRVDHDIFGEGRVAKNNKLDKQVAVHTAKFYAACTPVTIASSAGLCAGVSSFSPVLFHSSDDNKNLARLSIIATRFLTDSHYKQLHSAYT